MQTTGCPINVNTKQETMSEVSNEEWQTPGRGKILFFEFYAGTSSSPRMHQKARSMPEISGWAQKFVLHFFVQRSCHRQTG
jgi:hypothetical protein